MSESHVPECVCDKCMIELFAPLMSRGAWLGALTHGGGGSGRAERANRSILTTHMVGYYDLRVPEEGGNAQKVIRFSEPTPLPPGRQRLLDLCKATKAGALRNKDLKQAKFVHDWIISNFGKEFA